MNDAEKSQETRGKGEQAARKTLRGRLHGASWPGLYINNTGFHRFDYMVSGPARSAEIPVVAIRVSPANWAENFRVIVTSGEGGLKIV